MRHGVHVAKDPRLSNGWVLTNGMPPPTKPHPMPLPPHNVQHVTLIPVNCPSFTASTYFPKSPLKSPPITNILDWNQIVWPTCTLAEGVSCTFHTLILSCAQVSQWKKLTASSWEELPEAGSMVNGNSDD